MKTCMILLILFSFCLQKTFAQYAEFAIPESEMWITEYNANGPPQAYYHFMVNSDTVIDGTTYHKMIREKNKVVGSPSVTIKTIGFFNQNGGLITAWDSITGEILPYFNLDAEIGDTLASPIYYGIEEIDFPKFREFVIDTIYDTIISGATLKKFYVNYLPYECWDPYAFFWNSEIFIEQIGFLGYPLQWFNPGAFDGDYPGQLRCYQNDDLGLVKFVETECTWLETSIHETENFQIGIYPNPAEDKLFVSYNVNSKPQLKLINLAGAEIIISEITINENILECDISNIPGGMYFILIIFENEICGTEVFVKR